MENINNDKKTTFDNIVENNGENTNQFDNIVENKNKNIKIIIGVIIAIIVIGGGVFAFNYFKKPNITIDTSAPTAKIEEYLGNLEELNPQIGSYISEMQKEFVKIFDLTKEFQYNNDVRYSKNEAKTNLEFWEELQSSFDTELETLKSTFEGLFSVFPTGEISKLLEPLTKSFEEIETYIQNNIDAFSIYLGIKKAN